MFCPLHFPFANCYHFKKFDQTALNLMCMEMDELIHILMWTQFLAYN